MPFLEKGTSLTMKKKLRNITYVLLGLVVAILAFNIHLDIPVTDLKEKYCTTESKFIKINGMDVHYMDEGDGFPIVLLHGTAASLHTWEGWTTTLKQQYRVIRLDLPAFGLTGPHPSNEYSIKAYASFLDNFLATLEIEHFHLAGNSLGGNIAWFYAANYPAKVKKLLLLDPSGYPAQSSLPFVFRLAQTPVVNKLVRYVTPAMMIENNLRQVYHDQSKVTEELITRYHELMLREGNRQAFIERTKTPYIDHSTLLSSISARTLILWGKEDAWIPPVLATHFNKQIPQSELLILDEVGHVPMEEIPQESVKYALRFLKQ